MTWLDKLVSEITAEYKKHWRITYWFNKVFLKIRAFFTKNNSPNAMRRVELLKQAVDGSMQSQPPSPPADWIKLLIGDDAPAILMLRKMLISIKLNLSNSNTIGPDDSGNQSSLVDQVDSSFKTLQSLNPLFIQENEIIEELTTGHVPECISTFNNAFSILKPRPELNSDHILMIIRSGKQAEAVTTKLVDLYTTSPELILGANFNLVSSNLKFAVNLMDAIKDLHGIHPELNNAQTHDLLAANPEFSNISVTALTTLYYDNQRRFKEEYPKMPLRASAIQPRRYEPSRKSTASSTYNTHYSLVGSALTGSIGSSLAGTMDRVAGNVGSIMDSVSNIGQSYIAMQKAEADLAVAESRLAAVNQVLEQQNSFYRKCMNFAPEDLELLKACPEYADKLALNLYILYELSLNNDKTRALLKAKPMHASEICQTLKMLKGKDCKLFEQIQDELYQILMEHPECSSSVAFVLNRLKELGLYNKQSHQLLMAHPDPKFAPKIVLALQELAKPSPSILNDELYEILNRNIDHIVPLAVGLLTLSQNNLYKEGCQFLYKNPEHARTFANVVVKLHNCSPGLLSDEIYQMLGKYPKYTDKLVQAIIALEKTKLRNPENISKVISDPENCIRTVLDIMKTALKEEESNSEQEKSSGIDAKENESLSSDDVTGESQARSTQNERYIGVFFAIRKLETAISELNVWVSAKEMMNLRRSAR